MTSALGETGCRASEALGVTPQSVGDGTVSFTRQLARDGGLKPLKTRQSKRTIEVTRGLAAELKLAGDRERTFPRLTYDRIVREWAEALAQAEFDGPKPVVHDLRHSHASRLIAAGWDPVEISKRLGERVETTLRIYVHEFDARRRSAERRAALESLYGEDGYPMATNKPSQAVPGGARIADFPTNR